MLSNFSVGFLVMFVTLTLVVSIASGMYNGMFFDISLAGRFCLLFLAMVAAFILCHVVAGFLTLDLETGTFDSITNVPAILSFVLIFLAFMFSTFSS